MLLASCTATPNDPTLGLAVNPSFDGSSSSQGAMVSADASGQQSLAGEQDSFIKSQQAGSEQATVETNESLPSEVAFAPNASPLSTAAAATAASQPSADGAVPDLATATLTVRSQQPAPAAPQAQPQPAQAATEQSPATQPAQAQSPAQQVAASAQPSSMPGTVIENRVGESHGAAATATAPKAATSNAQQQRKQGFLSAFFSPAKANAAPTPASEAAHAPMIAQKATKPLIDQPKGKPLVQMAAVSPRESTGAIANDAGALPGVRTSALFEITRKSGLDDDSDVDLHEGEESPVRVASAAGLARLTPNGLLKQTDDVDVSCLKPALVRVLQSVERHYGKKVMITSGYRDPDRNRRARGARASLHMFCAAADVQVAGVSKWELANYVRSMPGRGGVGTYCHTDSVHIDVGPERDWNWRCRRRK